MRDWYNAPPSTAVEPARTELLSVSWLDIFEHWKLVDLDLHEVFGIDVGSGILRERTWKWFEDRVIDLLDRGPRIRQWRISRQATGYSS